jgi:hypothetical protein
VEHVERQDEREQELRSEVDDLEQQGDELESDAEKVDQQIGETREEFEQKKQSSEAPGIQDDDWSPTGEPPGDAAGGAPRTEEDE